MKKLVTLILTGALVAATLTGCGSNNGNNTAANNGGSNASSGDEAQADESSDFDASEYISVISREDGSGTRGAFIELFGIEQKDADGNKVDWTTDEAVITNSTEVMLTSVSSDDYAIGYVSLGSLNDTVKALKIDGAEATVDNIKSDTYKISRPFNIVTKEDMSDVAKDFVNYILSADGQKVIEDNGYISASELGAFTSDNSEGKIVIAGSSSVTPVMEKLKEAYLAVNTNAQIEIQESDSTTGITAAIDGTCDIGMASRELQDSEKESDVVSTVIAIDGIAVIVNKNSPLTELTTEDVMNIYTGEYTTWDSIIK